MLPKGVPVRIHFGQVAEDNDGNTTFRYDRTPDGALTNISFEITYNKDFVNANKGNLKSYGVQGLIVHEIEHARNVIINKQKSIQYPHTNPIFKRDLAKFMEATEGTLKYRSAIKPNASTRCYTGCKYNVVPSWVNKYWLYFCPRCGYINSYTTNLRARHPVCENCGYNKNLISKKLSVDDAAEMDITVQKNPKDYDSDRELKNFISKRLKKNLNTKQRSKI